MISTFFFLATWHICKVFWQSTKTSLSFATQLHSNANVPAKRQTSLYVQFLGHQSDFTVFLGWWFTFSSFTIELETPSSLRRILSNSRPEKAIIALQGLKCAGQQFTQSDDKIYRVSGVATGNDACFCPQVQRSLCYFNLSYPRLLSNAYIDAESNSCEHANSASARA